VQACRERNEARSGVKAKQTKVCRIGLTFVEVGDSFLEAYVPIVEKRKLAYTLNIKHGRKYVVVM
jgi:coproporphyrinogen III oxidase